MKLIPSECFCVWKQQYLGDPNGALDDFPDLDMEVELPEGLVEKDLETFRNLYRAHCEVSSERERKVVVLGIGQVLIFVVRRTDKETHTQQANGFKIFVVKGKVIKRGSIMISGRVKARSHSNPLDFCHQLSLLNILLYNLLDMSPFLFCR